MASSLPSSNCVKAEEDRLVEQMTSKCTSIEHLLKWTPIPQKQVTTKLTELELAVQKLDGQGYPSLQSQLKAKLVQYREAYSVALSEDSLPIPGISSPGKKLSSQCLVIEKSEPAQMPVKASSSFFPERQSSLDSLLQQFCPLMQSK